MAPTRPNPQSAGGTGSTAPGNESPPAPSTDTSDTQEAAKASQDASSDDSGKTFAVYASPGGVNTRVFTKKDFAQHAVDVDLSKPLRWDRKNNHVVDVSDLSEEALEVLGNEPNMTIKRPKSD